MEYLNEMKKELIERMEDIDCIQDILNTAFHCGYAEKTAENLFTTKEITHNQFADFITFVLDVRIDLDRKSSEIIYNEWEH